MWQRVGCEWVRAAGSGVECEVKLCMGPSRIAGAGTGLFVTRDVCEGERLGRMSGIVPFQGEHDACVEWALARADTRLVMLRRAGAWVVVNVRGCVFEFANSPTGTFDETMHVRENGWVEAACDLRTGDELLWSYGDLYSLAPALKPSWALNSS